MIKFVKIDQILFVGGGGDKCRRGKSRIKIKYDGREKTLLLGNGEKKNNKFSINRFLRTNTV